MSDSSGRRSPVARALLAAIGFYARAISPAFPPRCRFYPTCSAYAAEAVQRHGALRGTGLAMLRLLKCAPWHPGGVDLVPGTPVSTPGTEGHGHSSSTAAPPPAGKTATRPPHGAATRPPHRAPAQDRRRANEETSVA